MNYYKVSLSFLSHSCVGECWNRLPDVPS